MPDRARSPSVPTIPIRQGGKPGHAAYLQPPLATDRVRYVGAGERLGVKGAGEAGTSGVGAALANAVGPAATRHLPITASRVLAALDGTTLSS